MDQAVSAVLREYEKRSDAETAINRDMSDADFFKHRDEYLLSVGSATGQLIHMLATQAKAKTLVEVGSSYGYSTVWLADAARASGGTLISLEAIPAKQEYARAQIQKAGLTGFVEFMLGDARESLSRIESAIDFVLLDLWKNLYIPCFDVFYPKLAPGGLVVADNMTYPESALEHAMAYRKHVRIKRDMQSVLLPVGSGLEVSRCTRGLETILV